MDKAGANVGGEHGGLTHAILDAENLRREAGRNILFVHGMNVGWFGCGPHLFQHELVWNTRKVTAREAARGRLRQRTLEEQVQCPQHGLPKVSSRVPERA